MHQPTRMNNRQWLHVIPVLDTSTHPYVKPTMISRYTSTSTVNTPYFTIHNDTDMFTRDVNVSLFFERMIRFFVCALKNPLFSLVFKTNKKKTNLVFKYFRTLIFPSFAIVFIYFFKKYKLIGAFRLIIWSVPNQGFICFVFMTGLRKKWFVSFRFYEYINVFLSKRSYSSFDQNFLHFWMFSFWYQICSISKDLLSNMGNIFCFQIFAEFWWRTWRMHDSRNAIAEHEEFTTG